MPGRTPPEAVAVFLEPLREALKVLATATKISVAHKLRSSDGSDAWRMHWHPEGNSPVTWAHLHLPPDLKWHLPTERMTFEKAILWCVESGAALTCSRHKAADRLLLVEAPHRLHRSWV